MNVLNVELVLLFAQLVQFQKVKISTISTSNVLIAVHAPRFVQLALSAQESSIFLSKKRNR